MSRASLDGFITFAGLRFTGLRKNEILEAPVGIRFVATANAQIIRLYNISSQYRSALNKAVVTLDGTLPYWLARLTNPRSSFEKISGADLVYDFIRVAARDNHKIFLLGAEGYSNASAVQKIERSYGVKVEGFSPPIFKDQMPLDVLIEVKERLAKFAPHYLFAAFGSPKQELWIAENLRELEGAGVKFVIGCGGAIDFIAGRYKRAPLLIQKIGLEGIYRLAQQPSFKRLIRLFESATIFYYCLRYSLPDVAGLSGLMQRTDENVES